MQDIHTAARVGDIVAVQKIIGSNPSSVNSRDQHSRTPLHLAASAGQTEVVNILCKNNADMGAPARADMGAIHFAAQKGHLEVIQTLISSGVSLESATRKGMTPLHYAVQGSYIDIVKFLIEKGADLNVKNKAGKSPLDLAATEEIRTLLTCNIETQETSKNETESKTEESQQVGSENGDGSTKRKVEYDANNEVNAESKKTKVALNHLLASDDTPEDKD